MNRDGASPSRRRRRSVAAALPAALLLSLLLAAPVLSSPLAAPTPTPAAAQPASGASATGPRPVAAEVAVAQPQSAPTGPPRWSVSRGALGVLVLSYVGIGALAAAGIWSYVRRGRW